MRDQMDKSKGAVQEGKHRNDIYTHSRYRFLSNGIAVSRLYLTLGVSHVEAGLFETDRRYR